MAERQRQAGVTLIEVLVGFVIFMGSMVALLDHVGNQVYLERQGREQYRSLQALQQWITRQRLSAGGSEVMDVVDDGRVMPETAEIMDVYERRRQRRILQRQQFRLPQSGNRTWTVLELQ